MSQLNTLPVFACPRCGTPVVMTARTYVNDPKGDVLQGIAKNMGKVSFCPDCLRAKAYFESIGRPKDFGVSPGGILLSVVLPRWKPDTDPDRRYFEAPDPDRRRTQYFYKRNTGR